MNRREQKKISFIKKSYKSPKDIQKRESIQLLLGVPIPHCHLSRCNFLSTKLLGCSCHQLFDHPLNLYTMSCFNKPFINHDTSLANLFFLLILGLSSIRLNGREVQVRIQPDRYVPKLLETLLEAIDLDNAKTIRG